MGPSMSMEVLKEFNFLAIDAALVVEIWHETQSYLDSQLSSVRPPDLHHLTKPSYFVVGSVSLLEYSLTLLADVMQPCGGTRALSEGI